MEWAATVTVAVGNDPTVVGVGAAVATAKTLAMVARVVNFISNMVN